jgi:hypothetical protein
MEIISKNYFIDLRHIISYENYSNAISDFKSQGIDILPLETIKSLTQPLFILLKDFNFDFVFNNTLYSYSFKKGLVSDLASVPKFLQSFAQNDDPSVVIPSFIHDIDFHIHTHGKTKEGFKTANQIFKLLIKEFAKINNSNKLKHLIFFLPVSSKYALSRYHKPSTLKYEFFTNIVTKPV